LEINGLNLIKSSISENKDSGGEGGMVFQNLEDLKGVIKLSSSCSIKSDEEVPKIVKDLKKISL
jgi:hypothetical protein